MEEASGYEEASGLAEVSQGVESMTAKFQLRKGTFQGGNWMKIGQVCRSRGMTQSFARAQSRIGEETGRMKGHGRSENLGSRRRKW